MTPHLADVARLRRACTLAAVVAAVAYLAVLWDLGVDPLRRGPTGLNDDFFEIQARALLDGNLAVPTGSLGIEGFVVGGRTYMYFPPFPALLRLPVVALTERFDGRMTALSMLLAWIVLAVALGALVVNVRAALRRHDPVTVVEQWCAGLVVFAVLGGSAVTWIASRPWAYHEVFAWSTAWMVATVALVVRLLTPATADGSRAVSTTTGGALTTSPPVVALAASACALAAMLTRMPGGLAMALTVGAAGVVLARRRAGFAATVAIAGAVVTLAVGFGVNWLKFRHLWAFPISAHQWSAVSPVRLAALAANDGQISGLQFVATDLVAYFRPDGLRLTATFPFVSFPARAPQPVGDVVLDESFRTASVPALMPALLMLTLVGLLTLLRRRWWPAATAVAVPFAGAVLATGAVLTFGNLAPRYLCEFVPALAVGAVVGATTLGAARPAVTTARPAGRRRMGAVVGVVTVLTAFSGYAAVATAVTSARLTGQGDGLAGLLSARQSISSVTGDPMRDDVFVTDWVSLPVGGGVDRVAIVGDCEAIWVGTGETLTPWAAAALRPTIFAVDHAVDLSARPPVVSGPLPAGDVVLMTFAGRTTHTLVLELGEGQVRLRLDGPFGTTTDWVPTGDGPTVVVVAGDPDDNRWLVTGRSADGASVEIGVELTEWNDDFVSLPRRPMVEVTAPGGLQVTTMPGPAPALCDSLPRP